jgi:lipooligosaccharide transport system permease protein
MAGFGLVTSPWALVCLPAASLVSLAFGSVGLAATSFMSSWQDLGSVGLALLPLFLFSGTFYGLAVYPGWLQEVVRLSPLYQGVTLLRDLDVGAVAPGLLWHVAYLVAVGVVGQVVVRRRLRLILTP